MPDDPKPQSTTHLTIISSVVAALLACQSVAQKWAFDQIREDQKAERMAADKREVFSQTVLSQLLGIKVEAAAAKTAATALKDDVQQVGEKVQKELTATKAAVSDVKKAVDKIE
jgi:hypothetical protein